MDYIVSINSIEDYKKHTGKKWPFSDEAFDALNEYYKEENLRIYQIGDGRISIERWREFNNLPDLIEHVKSHSCMPDFCKTHMFNNIPNPHDEGFFTYVLDFIEFASNELSIRIIHVNDNLYLST